jgi:hypothetical protein
VNSADTSREPRPQVLPLDNDTRWLLALRVAQGSDFQRAKRLREFFLYICEKALTNRSDEIREQLIGVEVFGRPPDYNPAEVNIVRVEARDLRKRLDIYFLTEGRGEPIRIRIPKGGYVPRFEPNSNDSCVPCSPSIHSLDSSNEHASPNGERADFDGAQKANFQAPRPAKEKTTNSSLLLRDFFRPLGKIPLSTLVFAVLAAGLLAARLTQRGSIPEAAIRAPATAPPSPAGAPGIWTTLFPGSRSLEVVVADAGLPLIESADDRVIDLADYLNGKYVEEFESPRLPPIMFYPYTSLADVMATLEIGRTAEAQGKDVVVRYPRHLQIRDLASDNMVFLGSSYSDPWIREFDPERNFVLSVIDGRKGRLCFTTKSPRVGELKLYCAGAENSSTHETYGLITFLPNLQGSGNILILEGTDMQGTEGAADFITDLHSRSEIRQYLGLAGRTPFPYFQLLLKVGVVGSAPGNLEVIAHRTLSPSRL